MRLPRFHVRTMMIATAAVAIDLFLLRSVSGSFLILMPVGPIAGVAWAFYERRGTRFALLNGSLRGSVIQAVAIMPLLPGFLIMERVWGLYHVGNEWTAIDFLLWFVPLTSLGAGATIGLLAQLGNWIACRINHSSRQVPSPADERP